MSLAEQFALVLVQSSKSRSIQGLALLPNFLLEMVELLAAADLHHEDQEISLGCFSFEIDD